MSNSDTFPQLPGFEALCQAIGQPSMAVSERAYSPPTTPMELLTETSYATHETGTHSQGWFDVSQEEVQKTLEALRPLNLDRDALYQLAFEVDRNRALYEGEDLNRKAKNQSQNSALHKQRDSAVKHSRVEKRRRARHQGWQIQSHRMVPEFAHLCVSNDRVYLSKDDKDGSDLDSEVTKPRSSKSRNPKAGKDESFCGTIYSLAVCGIALQSEYEGRKLAEKQAQMYADRVAELEARLSKASASKYPPSPSASPTCSSSSHSAWPSQFRL
jgi:hypothetical protein